MKTEILYEDKEILVIHKPAGIATQTAKIGQADVVSELKNYLAGEQRRNGRAETPPYLGLVHRLDQPVEGALVFGKTQRATANLTEQLKKGSLNKYYFAAVCGQPKEPEGRVVDYLIKDGGTGMAKVVRETTAGAKKAVLDYEVLDARQVEIGAQYDAKDAWNRQVAVSLLKVHILTGRFHQIRVQMSHMDCPLLGDQKYGNAVSKVISNSLGVPNTALCAYHLEFLHPVSGKKLEYSVSPENRAFTLFQNFLS